MFAPGVHTEIEEFVGYIGQQLDGLRNAAHGLSEEQARATPCRSGLSIGGLLKHATYVSNGWVRRVQADGPPPTPDEIAARANEFMDSFALRDDETLAGALEAFDAAREASLSFVARTDPEALVVEPPAPWDGRDEPAQTRARFALLHHVEELARHAGHADIIREQLDGAAAKPLEAAVEGRPANRFVAPWTP